jgi:hypothetical protein
LPNNFQQCKYCGFDNTCNIALIVFDYFKQW